MRDELHITPGAIRVTAEMSQPVEQAIDVAPYHEVDVVSNIHGLEGAGQAVIRLLTGMQKETTAGWVVFLTFSTVTESGVADKKSGSGLLRYLRWEVSELTSDAVTFDVSGMGMRCGG